MTPKQLDSLCRMPVVFRERGHISMVQLVRDSGFDRSFSTVLESDINAHLRENSELVEAWVGYSQDQRCSPAWYLSGPGDGLEGLRSWSVGYYSNEGAAPETTFSDEFEACAFFIVRNLERWAESAG